MADRVEGIELDGLDSAATQEVANLQRVRIHLPTVNDPAAGVGVINAYFIANFSAQQAVDGRAQRLAQGVPLRNIDGGKNSHFRAADDVKGRAIINRIPDAVDIARIASQNPDPLIRHQIPQRADLALRIRIGFTHTHDAGVGVKAHPHPSRPFTVDLQILLEPHHVDFSDFHGFEVFDGRGGLGRNQAHTRSGVPDHPQRPRSHTFQEIPSLKVVGHNALLSFS